MATYALSPSHRDVSAPVRVRRSPPYWLISDAAPREVPGREWPGDRGDHGMSIQLL